MSPLIKLWPLGNERLKSLLIAINGVYFFVGTLAFGVSANAFVYGTFTFSLPFVDFLGIVGYMACSFSLGVVCYAVTYGLWTGKRWGLSLAILPSAAWTVYFILDFQARKAILGGFSGFSWAYWVYFFFCLLVPAVIVGVCLLPQTRRLLPQIALRKKDGEIVR